MKSKMNVLLGYDGSEHARSTLTSLHRAGLPNEAHAVVISVPRPSSKENVFADLSGNGGGDFDVEYAASMARQATELVRSHFPAWDVRAEVAVGSVVGNVVKKSRLWHPDLLVLALEDCLATGYSYYGGVAQRIAAELPCSIHMVRGFNDGDDDAPRVLLCIDDFSCARVMVDAVAARQWPKGTELRILTAIDPFDYSIPELLDNAIERAKQHQRIIANELNHTPAFTSSAVEEGDAASVILKTASRWKPDAVFLVPGKAHNLRRLLLSSVSSAVVARATCPVELVRPQRLRDARPAFGAVAAASAAYD